MLKKIVLPILLLAAFSWLLNILPVEIGKSLAQSNLPVLPDIGSVTVSGTKNTLISTKPDGNINRMGAEDLVQILVKDADGKPYPRRIYNSSLWIWADVELVLKLTRSDGITMTITDAAGEDGKLSIPVSALRSKRSCPVTSWWCVDNVDNPIPPGSVALNISPRASEVFDTKSREVLDVQLSGGSGLSGIKLFTVANPPNLTSLSKSSVKVGETVTLNGANFDVAGASDSIQVNQLFVDLNPATGFLRRVNIGFGTLAYPGGEDFIHYCGPTKIKFELPYNVHAANAVAVGKHTVTLRNNYGYSNTLDLTVVSGTGTPENDPVCAGSSGTITSISPNSGPAGTTVVIKGTGFQWPGQQSSIHIVSFGGVYATSVKDIKDSASLTVKQIEAVVPAGAKTGKITVQPFLKHIITGPTFTVTEGGEAAFGVDSISPQKLNIDNDNEILITGKGFSSPVLSADKTAISFSNVEVDNDGTEIRARATVGSTSAGLVKITVADGRNSGSINADLVVKDPASPDIADVEVSAPEGNKVNLVINGDDMLNATLQIYGIDAAISDVQTTENQLEATLTFTGLSSQKEPFWQSVFVKKVLAANDDIDKGVAEVCNTKGCDTTQLDAPKAKAGEEKKDGGEKDGEEGKLSYSAFKFKLENPFKAEAENIFDVLGIIATFIFQLGVPVAVIIIIYSGILYLVAGGRPAVVQKATRGLVYSLLGLAILLIGKGFVSLIQSILSVK